MHNGFISTFDIEHAQTQHKIFKIRPDPSVIRRICLRGLQTIIILSNSTIKFAYNCCCCELEEVNSCEIFIYICFSVLIK